MNKTEKTLSDEELALWCRQFDHHDPVLSHDNVYQIYELSTYPPFRLDGEVVWSHMEGGHHMGVRSLPVTFLKN